MDTIVTDKNPEKMTHHWLRVESQFEFQAVSEYSDKNKIFIKRPIAKSPNNEIIFMEFSSIFFIDFSWKIPIAKPRWQNPMKMRIM